MLLDGRQLAAAEWATPLVLNVGEHTLDRGRARLQPRAPHAARGRRAARGAGGRAAALRFGLRRRHAATTRRRTSPSMACPRRAALTRGRSNRTSTTWCRSIARASSRSSKRSTWACARPSASRRELRGARDGAARRARRQRDGAAERAAEARAKRLLRPAVARLDWGFRSSRSSSTCPRAQAAAAVGARLARRLSAVESGRARSAARRVARCRSEARTTRPTWQAATTR